MMFISTLIDATKRIKLGTGTVNMPNTHPAAVAANIAMLDHLLDGRFIFGISPGGLLSDAEVFGNLDANRNEMFLEAINQVLAIWAGEPPYDIEGKYWKHQHGAHADGRHRPGHPGQAAAEAAPAHRGHRWWRPSPRA